MVFHLLTEDIRIEMNNVMVSVIIPAYNCADFISQAIDSVLEQDVPLEIIVINDCSNDHLDRVMDFYKNYPEIRYLKNEKNMGVAETRNRGVSQAKGKYIAFLDGDDYWDKNKLKKQLQLIEQTGTVLCSTARELVRSNGEKTGYIIPVKEMITFRELCYHNQINCSSVILKTEVAKEFPMHHDDGHEDYLMWLEILEKYGTCCAINEPLLKYRVSANSKSGTKLKSAKMVYLTYRYMGFGVIRSLTYFLSYAIHGFIKYFSWYVNRTHQETEPAHTSSTKSK